MTTRLLINGAAIGTTPALPDPISVTWSDEGESGRTHSGALQSLTWSTVTLRWQPLSRAQFAALLAFYRGLSTVGFKIATSLTVPADDFADLVTWHTYTAPATGMWPRKPTGRVDADRVSHLVLDVEWVIDHVKPAELA